MIDSDSFSFGFEIQDDDILIIENNNTYVNVSYIPDNEERYFDKCNIEKTNDSYSIRCSPKRNVYALMNTLRIDITNLLKKRRLRAVSIRVLEDTTNTTLIPNQNYPGVINYIYNPNINKFIPKRNSSGLSCIMCYSNTFGDCPFSSTLFNFLL